MKKILSLFALLGVVGALSCGHDHQDHKDEPVGHEEHNETYTWFSQEQLRSIGIQLGKLEQKNLTHTQKVSGFLKVPNHNKAIITSVYQGVIRSILVQPGSYVRKGETIATISSPSMVSLQQSYINAQEQLKLATQEYERQKILIEGNASPLKRLQQAETNLKQAQANYDAIKEQIVISGLKPGDISAIIPIKSPISGSVSEVHAQIGSPVDPQTSIAEVVNNEVLHLDVLVYERDLPKVKTGQTIDFTLTNSTDGRIFQAKVFSIGTAFEKETKSIPVHAEVIGLKSGLIDGMPVTAIINLDNETTDALPSEAIITYNDQDYIFIVKDSTTVENKKMLFKRIPVKKGVSDMGYIAVVPLEDISNDLIVVKGAYFVWAKMNANTVEHEH